MSSVASRLYRPSLPPPLPSEFACRYVGFCAVNSGVFSHLGLRIGLGLGLGTVRVRVRVRDGIKFFT